jgi:hypothetical protein
LNAISRSLPVGPSFTGTTSHKKKRARLGRAKNASEGAEKLEKLGQCGARFQASGPSPMSVVTRLMISLASATICFGS